MKIVMASLAVLALAAPAIAQSADTASNTGFSASLGYSYWNADDGNLGAVTARGRYMFTDNFGAEGEASFGVGSEETYGFDIGISNSFGAFAVVGAPLSTRSNVFARLGYATTEFDVTGYGYDVSASIDGIAYGVGGEFFFTDSFGIRGDYTGYDGGDDIAGSAEVFSLAGVVRF
jgi:outer membrane immunogenic protein